MTKTTKPAKSRAGYYTTIQISPVLRKRFSEAARSQGRSMVWLASNIIERWLAEYEKTLSQ